MCMVAGYIRVSTETQEKGFGLDTQEREIRRYCAENGINLEKVFVDAGLSGAVKDTEDDDAINKRPGLIDLLASMQDGGKVIVLNTSRLWRSDVAKVIIRRELMKHHIQVVSIENPSYDLYTTNPNDRFMTGIMELMDEWERLTIAVKLAKGRTTKAKGGDKPAGVMPYGYKYSIDKKHTEVEPEEAKVIKRIFSEAQKGNSLGKIAKGLDADGITTRQGKNWSAGSIQVILRNRFYIGELTHKGKTIQGNHEPLISKVQFGKVAAALEKRNKKA